MNRIYESLKNNEKLKDKIEINESHGFISIDFNEYLNLNISYDANILNNGLTHWHPDDDEDILQDLTDIANGNIIFIENKCWFSPIRLKIIKKDKFEKKKEKYLRNKYLRIYSGNTIIKRNGERKKRDS